jgi:hypothetical protein
MIALAEDIEDMALSKAEKDWIQQTIESATKGRGWRKLVIWAQQWSIVAVALALFGGGITVFVMVFAGWKEMTETGYALDSGSSYR